MYKLSNLAATSLRASVLLRCCLQRRSFTVATAHVGGTSTGSTACTEIMIDGSSGWQLPATLTLPATDKPVPCVILFAGSGPTDRNWLSPLLPSGTGSGELIADGLRQRGVGSLRFDKGGSGKNMQPLEVLSLAHYVDEVRAAFDVLTRRPTACSSITLVGNSEGAHHMLRAAVELQHESAFAGYVSMAGTSRPLLDIAIEQIRAAQVKNGDDAVAIDAALALFRAAISNPGSSAPDFTVIPPAKYLWQAVHHPMTRGVAHELMMADPLVRAHEYHGRALVLAADHDLQVPVSDAEQIFERLGSPAASKKIVVMNNANHVFRHEDKRPADSSPQAIISGYVDPARPLAIGLVDVLAAFAMGTADS